MGIERLWRVRDVRLALEQGDLELGVEYAGETPGLPGVRCRVSGVRQTSAGVAASGHDAVPDVGAEVPRVRGAEHGVQQVRVPWAEAQSRFTEAMVIDWLRVASFAAVARQCRFSWDQVAGIQERAVRRGLSRRAVAAAPVVGWTGRRSNGGTRTWTVVNDLTTSEPRVLYVADGRTRAALDGYYFDAVGEASCGRIQMVAMDMWPAYIESVREHTEALIAFDRFHVAQHLGAAVDQVRRSENRALRQQGDDRLLKTRYLWLTRRGNKTQRQRRAFTPLRRSSLRVARAWAIKELATRLWDYRSRGWAVRMWRRWYGWAIRSRLEPIKKVARMIKRHWDGVNDAVLTKVTNARSEATNTKIQWIQRLGCGYRNRERFRNAIYFHLGGLDLYPDAVATHTKS